MPERFRILATSALHPDAEALLKKTCDFFTPEDGSAEALKRSIASADALIVRAKLPDDIFAYAPKLRACVRHGIGLDFIPVEAATKAGIPVANLPFANSQAVIEHTVGVIILVMRDLHRLANRFSTEGWKSRNSHTGFELAGKTLGVVGTGNIGTGVARAMRSAFGMRIVGYDKQPIAPEKNIEPMELEALFSEADIVTLHAPSTPQTRGIVNARLMGLMKRNAILVNAARGDLVDEQALIATLTSNRIFGAAVDVFEPEPLADDHPFRRIPNLFLTPHVAGLTEESSRRMSVESAEEALRILRGEQPLSLVNPEIWESYLARYL